MSGVSVKIKEDTLTPRLEEMRDMLAKGMWQVKVGVPDVEAKGSEVEGTTVSDVATWNEFGTEKIPERPFFRQGLAQAKVKLQRLNSANLRLILLGKKDVMVALGQMGAMTAGIIQQNIADGGDPAFAPNSPVTVALKKSSKPLIDTGQLRQSLAWELVKA